PSTERFDDTAGALRFLHAQRFVDPNRIGVIGWSNGGVFSIAVVNGPSLERARRRGVTLEPPGFAAAIAVYPGGCYSLVNELVTHLLPSVVHIHAVVARDHPSTQILGNDRLGSGVVVDASGLILSVNYVVMGAQAIEVAFAKGRRTRAEIVAQDFEVGLALLKVKRQGLPAAVLTDGDALEPGNAVIALASTGTQERRVGRGLVIYIGEFEAYWEYLLDHSIVTS